jgi:hypothetical protein
LVCETGAQQFFFAVIEQFGGSPHC